jgi:hypothetical protein
MYRRHVLSLSAGAALASVFCQARSRKMARPSASEFHGSCRANDGPTK